MRFASVMALLLMVCALRTVVHADRLEPDEEVARREYRAGAAAYDHNDYENALRHFAAAKEARPLPEFDFNLARCFDRLGRWQEAADAYARFIAAAPSASNAAEVSARIDALRTRHSDVASMIGERVPDETRRIDTTPSRARLRLAASIVLGSAVVAGAVGGAVYGSAYHEFSQRDGHCAGTCPPDTTVGLRDSVRTREIVSGVMWGLAGAALIADLFLWARYARRDSNAHIAGGVVTF